MKAGVDLKIGRTKRGPGGHDQGMQIELSGDDGAILELLSRQVMAMLKEMPFVKDVDSSSESGDEEIHVAVDRERALQAGLSTQDVARTINNALSTRPVTYFKAEDREVGMVVQYREEDRETLEQLKKMSIHTDATALPIASLASFETVPGPQTIEAREPQLQGHHQYRDGRQHAVFRDDGYDPRAFSAASPYLPDMVGRWAGVFDPPRRSERTRALRCSSPWS